MAGIFNVDINRDGAVNINGNWYSRATLPINVPRKVFWDYGKLAILAYITEDEYNLIQSNFPDYVYPSQPIIGVNGVRADVDFIGPAIRVQFLGATPDPLVAQAPFYFIDRTPGAPVHKLVYITTEAQQYLIDTDFYDQDLANNDFVGPFGIPIYWGDPGSGPSAVGGGTGVGPSGGSSGTNSASVDGGTCSAGSFGSDGSYCGPGFNYDGGGYDGGSRAPIIPIVANSGVYNGSLSSQGNMVAMQLGTGDFTIENGQLKPYHEGYFKTYYRNPSGDIFGANTPMPALTGVMPEKFTDVPGNAVYYTDIQLYRVSGSNQWDQFYFQNVFGSAVSWVTLCNNYLVALKKAETTDLAYYGADSLEGLSTQGFDQYKIGSALVTAFRNIGNMASLITAKNNAAEPYFGTANAVAEVLIDNGLGYINNLSTNLYAAGVNFEDIGNSLYTDFITEQLLQIRNTADLETIQEVLGSNIPNIANPLDYVRIDRASGLPNDSVFADFAAVGRDFVNRAPNLVLTNGGEIADLINSIQADVASNVEALSGNTLVTQEAIDSLRHFLPFGANNEPVTVLQVIGTASGYQNTLMNAVNEGISQLFATEYGPQIRDTFTEISRLSAFQPLTAAEQSQSLETWQTQLENKKEEYYTLINTIVSDTTGNLPAIVNQINTNYDAFTTNIYYEFLNYNKANIQISSYGDNNSTLSFVQSLPGYAADTANIATDYMLYGLTQDNVGGETARAVLDTGKNDLFLQQAGVEIQGVL